MFPSETSNFSLIVFLLRKMDRDIYYQTLIVEKFYEINFSKSAIRMRSDNDFAVIFSITLERCASTVD